MHTRRNFIKQAGITAGALAVMPSFSSVFAAENKKGIPHRFIFIRKSNGNIPAQFSLPTFSEKEKSMDKAKKAFVADLDKHELPVWLRALTPYKENMSVFHGISCTMSEGGHWSYSSPLGAFKSGRNSLSGIKRATIDFELAKLFPSPFGHVELSLTGNYSSFRTGIVSGYSAPAAHQRNYCYADPLTAYNELFKSVINPGAVDSDNAMLKFLEEEEGVNIKSLKGLERDKLSTHISSIEAVQARNKKVQKMSGAISKFLPELDKVHDNGGLNASTPEKQGAMTDILIAALATGLTNVVTYTIDELSTPIKGIPGNEGDHISIHEVGHNGGYSGVSADKIREKLKAGHMAQVETIIKKLKAIPEGKGNMFDNTTIIYMPENGAGHHNPTTEMPMIVMTGKNSKLDLAGRFIRLPFHATEGHKTLGNWYTTLLNLYGNPIKHYGDLDLTMSRKKLDQIGPIRQIMRA